MASSKTTAQRLLDEGRSSRLDNISRAMLLDGAFQTLLDRDIVGMTRHSRIVQEATGGSDADEHGRFVHADESVAAYLIEKSGTRPPRGPRGRGPQPRVG